MPANTSRSWRGVLRPAVLLGLLAVAAAPLFLMLLTSVQEQSAAFTDPLNIRSPLQWNNYERAWRLGGLVEKAGNSAVVTLGSVALATICGALTAYACARLRRRAVANAIVALFALGLFVPIQTGVVPLFMEMKALGLLDTLMPMILTDAVMVMPITVLLLTAFFRAVPIEVEEAASIDGAGRIRILLRIVLPMARTAVVTSIILSVVAIWNDYFIALVFATSPSLRTLPLGLATFHGDYQTDWPATLAYSVMIAAPVFLLYVLLQRHITQGVAAGVDR